MSTELTDAKLTLLFRVEPGCLGPDGKVYIDEFCHLAQQAFASNQHPWLAIKIVPRYDKQRPETEYLLGERGLNRSKAERYMMLHGKALSQLECQLNDLISDLIDHYLRR